MHSDPFVDGSELAGNMTTSMSNVILQDGGQRSDLDLKRTTRTMASLRRTNLSNLSEEARQALAATKRVPRRHIVEKTTEYEPHFDRKVDASGLDSSSPRRLPITTTATGRRRV